MISNSMNSAVNNYTDIGVKQSNTSSEASLQKPSGGEKIVEQKKENSAHYTKKADFDKIKNAVDLANDKMKATKTRCEFSFHEGSKRVSIKIFDKETDEIIREVPPEESLEMIEKLWEIAGLFVDETR